jgi:uncharacterized protein GlcG (DUF336 family)
LKDAQRLIEVAAAESQRRGFKTGVAVVDARGDLIMAVRNDGARFYYPEAAFGKAMCAAIWQEDSRQVMERAERSSVQQRVSRINGDRIVFAAGGVPLRRDGVVVGAIGIGGAGPDNDHEIATVVAQAFD